MAGNGVRLATGYIEITAETSKVPQQIQDALNKAAQGAKPAGEKIGKDISDGLRDGMNANLGKSGQPLGDQIAKSANAKAAGKKIGTDISEGVREGTSQIGPQVDSALRDIGRDALNELQSGVRDWGNRIGEDLRSGRFKAAFDEIGGSIEATTRGINNLGHAVGVNLDGVEGFGHKVATTLDSVGGGIERFGGKVDDLKGKIEGTSKNIQTLAGDTSKLGESLGGLNAAIGPVSLALAGLDTFMPGFHQHLEAVVNGKGGWKDWVNILVPLTNLLDEVDKKLRSIGQANLPPGAVPTTPNVSPGTSTVPGIVPPGGQPPTVGGIPIPGLKPGQGGGAGGGVGGNYPGSGNPSTQRNQSNLLPVTQDVKDSLNYWFPGHTIGGYRQDQPQYANEHPAGKALDFMINSKDEGYKALPLALSQPGVDYVIFDGKMWYPDGRSEAYYGDNPHNDHLHIHTEPGTAPGKRYAKGGDVLGRGEVPIMAHGGEHVLAANDVAAMGGQSGVYAFRKALHYQNGGAIDDSDEEEQFARFYKGNFNPNVKLDPSIVRTHKPNWLQNKWNQTAYVLEQIGFPQLKGVHFPRFQEGGAINIHELAGAIVDQAQGKPQDQPTEQPDAAKPALEAIDAMRSMGLIPQGAGSKAVAGTSMIAGFLNLGNEAIGGLIDAGASAAVQAIGIAAAAGAGAGSFGGGAAAGPLASGAASIPIGIAANEGKRAVSYGFQLASIAADSMIDQIFGPFGGPPRWIGFDYSQFMPQIDVGGIATTTVEKAFAAAQAGGNVPASQQPGGPVVPQMQTGGQPVGQTLPRFGTMAAPLEQTAIPHLGSGQPPGPPPGAGPPQGPTSRPGQTGDKVATLNPPPPPPPTSTAPGPQPPQNQPSPFGLFSPTEWLGFDEGGVWPPGRPGMNATGRPELVLSPAQLDMIASAPELNGGWGAGDTYHITAMDAADVARQIDARKQLAMMRYAGRP